MLNTVVSCHCGSSCRRSFYQRAYQQKYTGFVAYVRCYRLQRLRFLRFLQAPQLTSVALHVLCRSVPCCAASPAAPRQFEPLLAAAASAGFSLDCSSSKALAASLDEAVRGDDAYFNKLVRIMATR